LVSNNSGLDNRLVGIGDRSISRGGGLNVLDWLLNCNSGVLDWLLDNLGLLNVLNGLDWLLNVLNLLDWLLNVLDLLGWLVDYLSFNCLVFNSFLDSFLGNIFNDLVLENLGNVLSLVFDGIVISHFFFSGNILSGVDWLLDFFVFDFGSFIGNVLNS